MMIDGLLEYGNVNYWLENGGVWFFSFDYEKEVLVKVLVYKLVSLLFVIELVIVECKIVICYVDYLYNEYVFDKLVLKDMVIWNCEWVSDVQDGIVLLIVGVDLFIFGYIFVCQFLKYVNQMYIDIGVVFCGNFMLVQV